MSLYSIEHTLLSADVDTSRRLRLSTLFTMLQEASIAHTTELGMGREKTLDKGLLWILTLQQATIRRLPVYDEHITLTSWPNPTMHLYFPRSYRMTGETGETLMEASALWALMDQKSRRIVFPEQHGIIIEGTTDRSDPPFPRAPKMPELTSSHSFTVPYSYTDLNGHMNNTRYFDLAEDSMPGTLRSRAIRTIQVEYSAEAKENETITLHTAASDTAFAIVGETDKRLFRMLLTYE